MSELTVENLALGYLAEPVLRSLSLEVRSNEVVAVLGPNGVGKTTLLKGLCGLVEARAGRVVLAGEDVTGLVPEARARKGMSLVPEGRRLFANLTTLENLRVGRSTGRTGSTIEEVLDLFPALVNRLNTKAGSLSGGEQQMLAIGRSLCGGPRVLLLDEPSLGLAPLITRDVFEVLRQLGATGAAVVLGEQNVEMATEIADRCLVLNAGAVAFEGPSTSPAERAAVKAAYSRLVELEHA